MFLVDEFYYTIKYNAVIYKTGNLILYFNFIFLEILLFKIYENKAKNKVKAQQIDPFLSNP